MSENSQWRLPALSDEQKHWLVDARASGMDYAKITDHFREVFPGYAPDIPSDVFPGLFTYRLKRILDGSQSGWKALLAAKQRGELPINVGVVPIANPQVRQTYYQQIWDETPAQSLHRVVETEDGVKEFYKENTRERLAILAQSCTEFGLKADNSEENPLAEEAEEVIELIDSAGIWKKPTDKEPTDADTE